jgi:hypothetical protein
MLHFALLDDLSFEVENADMMGFATPIDAYEKATRDCWHWILLDDGLGPAATNVAPVLALFGATPHGTFGCGQTDRALLRTRH